VVNGGTFLMNGGILLISDVCVIHGLSLPCAGMFMPYSCLIPVVDTCV
jgi:hypothetical protein